MKFNNFGVFRELSRWLDTYVYNCFSIFQARAQDAAVVIVGTHYDEMAPQTRKELIDSYRIAIKTRYVSSALGGGIQRLNEKGLPRVLAIAEVSCKNRTEHNIRDLRNIIYETATSLKDSRKFIRCYSCRFN